MRITILNVALPTLAGDLSAGTAALQWIVNVYILVVAGLILTCGASRSKHQRTASALRPPTMYNSTSVR